MKTLVATLAIFVLPLSAFAQSRHPIEGAWEQVSSKNIKTGEMQKLAAPPLRLVYTDGHYVQFRAAANRSKIQMPRNEMTKEQLLERLDMQGQYGTYRIEANRLMRKVLSAADPNNEGRETTVGFRIEGDTLITTGAGAGGQGVGPTETRYRRLKPTS
jgi:hypothetical protein